jgi:hypothetical protein
MTANTENTLHHIYAGDIAGAKVTDTPRGGNNGTGYGPKIPTPYMLQSFGPRPVWRRVYVVNYGNAGSTYVSIGGKNHYLSPGAELILETIRDGGTLEAARLKMAEWPEWMKDGEHLHTAPKPLHTALQPGTYSLTTIGRDGRPTGQLVTDWSGVAAHLERDGVSTTAAVIEAATLHTGYYSHTTRNGEYVQIRAALDTSTTEDGNN